MGTSKEIRVEVTVQEPIDKVWKYWTEPDHIKQWNNASEDWHTPFAENDLRIGGAFVSRMEAKDGSTGFDFGGIYDDVILHEVIAYTMADGRKVNITFKGHEKETEIVETFDSDASHPAEFQQQGWQAILENFKSYVEQNEH